MRDPGGSTGEVFKLVLVRFCNLIKILHLITIRFLNFMTYIILMLAKRTKQCLMIIQLFSGKETSFESQSCTAVAQTCDFMIPVPYYNVV